MPATRLLAKAQAIQADQCLPLAFPAVNAVSGRITLAEVNAGINILKLIGGPSIIRVVPGFVFRPIGGAFAALTDIRLSTDAGTPVDIVTMDQANLTENAYMVLGGTGVTTNLAAFLVNLASNSGLQIRKTGDAGTTATHLDYYVPFQVMAGPGIIVP